MSKKNNYYFSIKPSDFLMYLNRVIVFIFIIIVPKTIFHLDDIGMTAKWLASILVDVIVLVIFYFEEKMYKDYKRTKKGK